MAFALASCSSDSPSTVDTACPGAEACPEETGAPDTEGTPSGATTDSETGEGGAPSDDAPEQDPPDEPTMAEDCDVADVQRDPRPGWADSYSSDGKCYCATTYDHNIGEVMVDTPRGPRTVREVCEAIGRGPGMGDNPVYNDVQCGHGPANDAGDEDWCPGRTDLGRNGCCTIGPQWDLSVVP